MKGNWLLATVLGMSLSVSAALPEASAKQLPRWRGFNLLEKFMFWGQNPQPRYQEEDFKMIHDLGFNFVRLPMDYRFWIIDGDWEKINYERQLPSRTRLHGRQSQGKEELMEG